MTTVANGTDGVDQKMVDVYKALTIPTEELLLILNVLKYRLKL